MKMQPLSLSVNTRDSGSSYHNQSVQSSEETSFVLFWVPSPPKTPDQYDLYTQNGGSQLPIQPHTVQLLSADTNDLLEISNSPMQQVVNAHSSAGQQHDDISVVLDLSMKNCQQNCEKDSANQCIGKHTF